MRLGDLRPANAMPAPQAAAFYASRGLRVLPVYGVDDAGCRCRSPDCAERDWGKHEPPETEGRWKGLCRFTPADFRDGDNVAIAMGPQSPIDEKWLVCLDFDGDPRALDLPQLPDTLTESTPRGEHRYFWVSGYTPLGNWIHVVRRDDDGDGLWCHVDLRYARGRSVVSPSRGASGVYRWQNDLEPTDLPQWFIDRVLEDREERGLKNQDHWDRGDKLP